MITYEIELIIHDKIKKQSFGLVAPINSGKDYTLTKEDAVDAVSGLEERLFDSNVLSVRHKTDIKLK